MASAAAAGGVTGEGGAAGFAPPRTAAENFTPGLFVPLTTADLTLVWVDAEGSAAAAPARRIVPFWVPPETASELIAAAAGGSAVMRGDGLARALKLPPPVATELVFVDAESGAMAWRRGDTALPSGAQPAWRAPDGALVDVHGAQCPALCWRNAVDGALTADDPTAPGATAAAAAGRAADATVTAALRAEVAALRSELERLSAHSAATVAAAVQANIATQPRADSGPWDAGAAAVASAGVDVAEAPTGRRAGRKGRTVSTRMPRAWSSAHRPRRRSMLGEARHAHALSGMLLKAGTNILAPWKARFFAMQTHYLCYKQSRGDSEFAGGIDIVGPSSSVQLVKEGTVLKVTGLDAEVHDDELTRLIRTFTLKAVPTAEGEQPSVQAWHDAIIAGRAQLRAAQPVGGAAARGASSAAADDISDGAGDTARVRRNGTETATRQPRIKSSKQKARRASMDGDAEHSHAGVEGKLLKMGMNLLVPWQPRHFAMQTHYLCYKKTPDADAFIGGIDLIGTTSSVQLLKGGSVLKVTGLDAEVHADENERQIRTFTLKQVNESTLPSLATWYDSIKAARAQLRAMAKPTALVAQLPPGAIPPNTALDAGAPTLGAQGGSAFAPLAPVPAPKQTPEQTPEQTPAPVDATGQPPKARRSVGVRPTGTMLIPSDAVAVGVRPKIAKTRRASSPPPSPRGDHGSTSRRAAPAGALAVAPLAAAAVTSATTPATTPVDTASPDAAPDVAPDVPPDAAPDAAPAAVDSVIAGATSATPSTDANSSSSSADEPWFYSGDEGEILGPYALAIIHGWFIAGHFGVDEHLFPRADCTEDDGVLLINAFAAAGLSTELSTEPDVDAGDDSERRTASDGSGPFTREEFVAFYGDADEWDACAP